MESPPEQQERIVDWSQLPTPALAKILSHLPSRQRFGHGNCYVLFSRTWADAATAEVDSIEFEGCENRSFQLWINRHGQHLTKLHLSCDKDYGYCSSSRNWFLQPTVAQAAAHARACRDFTMVPSPKLEDLVAACCRKLTS